MSHNSLTALLVRIAETLDIPDHLYEEAVLKYEDVGEWLAEDESELARFSPEIYPQGSFRLGTMIKPISDKEEYDIDLVCHLAIAKNETSKDELKSLVGDRLKARDDLEAMLKECRRCWTLKYPVQFHMDVLPAIPNEERPPTGILLTDVELHRWQMSNPIAYADWFYKQMEVIFFEKRAAIAEELQAKIEEVPHWQVKTPLQRAVQILKRHRDVYFQSNQDDKPVSIIITTLAAHAYGNQADLRDAILDIARDMPKFIEYENGKWSVRNPVDPDENFADKWNENPQRRQAFLLWLKQVQGDFGGGPPSDLNEAVARWSPSIGEGTVKKAAEGLGTGAVAPSGLIKSSSDVSVPALADITHCQMLGCTEQIRHSARLSGTVHRSRRKPNNLWGLTKRSVPKGVQLRFKVETNTPHPYTVRWQVVNTGQEAREADDLRGDFYGGEEEQDAVRWEHTEYAGTHWVEAFILKDGVCVAKTGRKYVKIRG